MRGTIHAARPGLAGDHRTDGIRCRCDPHVLMDINEPHRAVIVHRPMSDGVPGGGRIPDATSEPRAESTGGAQI
jgi:hypothetical protein